MQLWPEKPRGQSHLWLGVEKGSKCFMTACGLWKYRLMVLYSLWDI